MAQTEKTERKKGTSMETEKKRKRETFPIHSLTITTHIIIIQNLINSRSLSYLVVELGERA